MVVIKHFGNTPGGGHYMCFVGEKRCGIQRKIWWCINDSFPIKLMERRRPQQTRTENDYQQLDEGRLNEGTVLIPEKGQNSPIFGSFKALLTSKMAFLIAYRSLSPSSVLIQS